MPEELDNLRSVLKWDEMKEQSYHKRVKQANHCGGNVEEDNKKIKLYIDELSNIIPTIFTLCWDSALRLDLNFKYLRHFTQ